MSSPAAAPDPSTAPGARRRAVVLAWLAVAACTSLILVFSGEGFSARSTSRFLGPLLRWLIPDLDARTLLSIHLAVRKLAHLTEYLVLGLLAYRAWRLSLGLPILRTAALGLMLVVAVAGTDELRQSFSAVRTGSLADVALDFTGGLLGVCLIATCQRAGRRAARP